MPSLWDGCESKIQNLFQHFPIILMHCALLLGEAGDDCQQRLVTPSRLFQVTPALRTLHRFKGGSDRLLVGDHLALDQRQGRLIRGNHRPASKYQDHGLSGPRWLSLRWPARIGFHQIGIGGQGARHLPPPDRRN
jgi:hypothetical protein